MRVGVRVGARVRVRVGVWVRIRVKVSTAAHLARLDLLQRRSVEDHLQP